MTNNTDTAPVDVRDVALHRALRRIDPDFGELARTNFAVAAIVADHTCQELRAFDQGRALFEAARDQSIGILAAGVVATSTSDGKRRPGSTWGSFVRTALDVVDNNFTGPLSDADVTAQQLMRAVMVNSANRAGVAHTDEARMLVAAVKRLSATNGSDPRTADNVTRIDPLEQRRREHAREVAHQRHPSSRPTASDATPTISANVYRLGGLQ